MSIAAEIFKMGSEAIGALLKLKKAERYEVSEHFANLSRAFKAYPGAHRTNDRDQVDFLVGKTAGLIEALQGVSVFQAVLGESKSGSFFGAIRRVLVLKELMKDGGYTEPAAAYSEILAIAGYFEGYSESLKAQAGKP